jgi:hypothetical protein
MYWLCISGSDLTSSIMWPANGQKSARTWDTEDSTMLVSKLDWAVDPSAFLGDVQLDLKLLLDKVITKMIIV